MYDSPFVGRSDELNRLAGVLAEARGGDRAPQGPEGQAWPARAEAEWGRGAHGADADARQRAVAAFGFGDRHALARCRLRLAEALVGEDRRAEAAAEAGPVLATAHELGAPLLLQDARRLARRARPPVPGTLPGAATPSRTGEGGPPPPTAREQEVLRLPAEGRSNRQIGEALFISAKTASVHVSNILAKLSVSGRTEAVAVTHREGLLGEEPFGEA